MYVKKNKYCESVTNLPSLPCHNSQRLPPGKGTMLLFQLLQAKQQAGFTNPAGGLQ